MVSDSPEHRGWLSCRLVFVYAVEQQNLLYLHNRVLPLPHRPPLGGPKPSSLGVRGPGFFAGNSFSAYLSLLGAWDTPPLLDEPFPNGSTSIIQATPVRMELRVCRDDILTEQIKTR